MGWQSHSVFPQLTCAQFPWCPSNDPTCGPRRLICLAQVFGQTPPCSEGHPRGLHPRIRPCVKHLHPILSFVLVPLCLVGDCGFVPVITWGFPGGSAGEESTCNVGDLGSVPELGKSPGEGKGYPLQYSDLENSMEKSMGSQRVRHYWATFTSPVITWASPYSWLDGDSLRAGALSELTGERRVSPGKGGGGGLVAKSCPDSCDPVACSPPGSSVRGILQARTLEWVAILQRGCPVIIRRMHFPW